MGERPAYASCPQNVRAVDFGHVLVLIDYRTGRALSLLPPAGQQWDEASRTGALDAMDRPLAHQLLALDLLTATRSPMPWPPAAVGTSAQASWGGSEHQAGRAARLAPPSDNPRSDRRTHRRFRRNPSPQQRHAAGPRPADRRVNANHARRLTRPGDRSRARRPPRRLVLPRPHGLPGGVHRHRPPPGHPPPGRDLVPRHRVRPHPAPRLGTDYGRCRRRRTGFDPRPHPCAHHRRPPSPAPLTPLCGCVTTPAGSAPTAPTSSRRTGAGNRTLHSWSATAARPPNRSKRAPRA